MQDVLQFLNKTIKTTEFSKPKCLITQEHFKMLEGKLLQTAPENAYESLNLIYDTVSQVIL